MPTTPSPAHQQDFHPEVVRAAAAALLPAQSLFENAWKITVSRVQAEFTQIHSSLTSKLDAEKAAHAHTLESCARLRHELEDARYERGLVNGERERLSAELVKAAKETRILRANLAGVMSGLKESKERCDLLAAENEIWKKGWAVAKTVTSRLQERYGGKSDDPSQQNGGERDSYPPELLQQIREQIDLELQARIGKSGCWLSPLVPSLTILDQFLRTSGKNTIDHEQRRPAVAIDLMRSGFPNHPLARHRLQID
jgi:hypothetical protein